MMDFFSKDGPIFSTLNKTGELLLLGLCFVLTSIPVITIGASASALYYAVVKSVRRERGYCIKEYINGLGKFLLKGSLLTLTMGLVIALSLTGLYSLTLKDVPFVPDNEMARSIMRSVYYVLIIVVAITGIYIFPVLSRFEMKLKEIIKLSFVMALRFFYYTLIILSVIVMMFYLYYKFLPVWAAVFVPGILTYLLSFLIERAMKKYIVVTDENKDQWYIF